MMMISNLFIALNILIFHGFMMVGILLFCGKGRKRQVAKGTPGTGAAAAKTPQQQITSATQPSTPTTNNVKFADADDPINKTVYGVDDGVFKPKKGAGGGKTTEDDNNKVPAGSKDKNKGNNKNPDGKATTTAAATGAGGVKKGGGGGSGDVAKKNEKKKDDSGGDKTDLRSLTLEQNLAAVKKGATTPTKPKNPAGQNRSQRLPSEDNNNNNAGSGYAAPIPKKASAEGNKKKNPKKNNSAYL